MDTESFVQPRRYFTASEIAGELAGILEVLGPPEITTGYADIYHGILKTPEGEQVDVAIKEFKAIIPRNRSSDLEALRRRTDTIYQAATGLYHLHSLTPPICHADIKPENVLINDWCEAALSDFGLSRVLLGLEESSGLTTTGVVRGTLRYMAGELHIDEKRRPNLETDVFAFGGLILTVMSGKPPFPGLRDSIILLRIIGNQTPRPEEHPDFPRGDHLWNLIHRCWDKNPASRPTMQEVLRELWGEMSREESGRLITVRPLPNEEIDASERPYVDLDTPATAIQTRIYIQDTWNPVPGSPDDSSSSGPEVGGTLNAIGGVLPAARRIFGGLEVNSKVIPVIGRFVRAAAEVGLML
ncbi:Ankyrin repeat and protein kinase domain-containing protein 1, partial [Tulasnella sp. 417]